ncbi:MAG: hydrolase [Candidatus Saccharibacteria bacterium]|nr:hydrolase [Candidatus Saccharibacteria bacterium]
MIPPNFYRISIKGIAIDDTGRFLLSKEDNGKWEMLGGGLDYGEDPIDGLKREIKEETGLTVTYVSPSPKYFITCPRHDNDTFIANVIYEIKLENLDFTPSDECQELKHFNVEEAKQLDLFPNVEALLKIYNVNFHL